MRTRSGPVSGHGSASSARCASTHAATAATGSANAAWKASPIVLKWYPPWARMAAARMALCRSSATRIVVRSRSHRRVDPSMSVNRKVTSPEGGAKGMIGVEGTATMKVQSTKPGHREDDGKVARPSDSRYSDRPASPGSILHRGMAEPVLPMCTYRETANVKLVKIGQNWYYSLHA